MDKHPEAPVALLKAYRQARDVAMDRLYGSDPEILITSWVAAAIDEQRAVMGENYWSYNIQDNVTSLEAMMTFAHQFGLTRRSSITRTSFTRRLRHWREFRGVSDYASLIRPTPTSGAVEPVGRISEA